LVVVLSAVKDGHQWLLTSGCFVHSRHGPRPLAEDLAEAPMPLDAQHHLGTMRHGER